jgi:hypothetical protein
VALVAALTVACLAWTHAARMPDAHCAELADAIASTDASEREGLDLVALAWAEGGLLEYAWSGECNSHPQSRAMLGRCDSGHAWGAWQQHLGPFVPAYVPKPGGRTEILTGWTLIGDKRFAASCALALYRVSPANWSTWAKARAIAGAWRLSHPSR